MCLRHWEALSFLCFYDTENASISLLLLLDTPAHVLQLHSVAEIGFCRYAGLIRKMNAGQTPLCLFQGESSSRGGKKKRPEPFNITMTLILYAIEQPETNAGALCGGQSSLTVIIAVSSHVVSTCGSSLFRRPSFFLLSRKPGFHVRLLLFLSSMIYGPFIPFNTCP